MSTNNQIILDALQIPRQSSWDRIIKSFAQKELAGFAMHLFPLNTVNTWREREISSASVSFDEFPKIEISDKNSSALLSKAKLMHTVDSFLFRTESNSYFPIYVEKSGYNPTTNISYSENPLFQDKMQLSFDIANSTNLLEADAKMVISADDGIQKVKDTILDNTKSFGVYSFFSNDVFGWKIKVELDFDQILSDKPELPDGDILGYYNAGYDDNNKNSEPTYPFGGEPSIKLYMQAIGTYAQQLGAENKIPDIVAYVLAHELFHAWQDFHYSTKYYKEQVSNYEDIKKEDIEIFAEAFSLLYVRDVIDDSSLFEELVKSSYYREQFKNIPNYGEMLENIKNVTDKEFADSLDSWKKSAIKIYS